VSHPPPIRSDKRRLLDAFSGGTPSGPPFFEELIEQRPAEQILARSVAGDTRDMGPADYVDLARRLGLDAIVAHTGGWLAGGRYEHASDGTRHYVGGSAATMEELLSQPFDPSDARRSVARSVEAVQDTGLGVIAWLPGIVTSPAIALGYERLALALYDDPQLVERASDAQAERTLRALDAAADAGADMLALGEDISDSTGPMMAPDRLRDLWLGRASSLTARARQRGLPIMLHCCGHLAAVLPLAIEAGFDAVQPVAACNDVPAVAAAARGRIALAGTIDVGSALVRGAPGEVASAVRAHWRSYGPTGFVIGSNHSINNAVPGENLRALARAVADLRAEEQRA